MNFLRIPYHLIVLFPVLFTFSCVYDQIDLVEPPCPGKESADLVAEFASIPPVSLNDPFWICADYVNISVQDILMNQVNETDGILNVSGTFDGLSDFNGGDDPEVQFKAAYDNENLYILASWKDNTFNMEQRSWLYDGKSDPNKVDDPSGWTAQRSDDKIELSFKIDDTTHDLWRWSLALSEPMGFATDMFDDGALVVDDGDIEFLPNMVGADYRSGPLYEWNGVQQEVTRELGGFTILDPGFYLLNTMDFQGDIGEADVVYQNNCALCHGELGDGNGEIFSGVRFTVPGRYNRISREAFQALVDVPTHDGRSYWQSLNAEEQNLAITRIRAFTGIPGYILENPNGNAPDVQAASNVILARIDGDNSGYKVLFVRKLNTGKTDDITFDKENTYQFMVNLYDNDEINKVGSAEYINLIFK